MIRTVTKRWHLHIFVGLLAVIWTTQPAFAQTEPGPRVLFLGNSAWWSHGGSLAPFEGYCLAAGFECEARHNYDFFGKPPEGRVSPFLSELAEDPRVTNLLSTEKFDYVVLWTRHYAVFDSLWQSTLEGLMTLVPSIAASGATIVLAASSTPVNRMESLDLVEERFKKLQQAVEEFEINGKTASVLYVPFGRLWVDGAAQFGKDAWYADRVHGTRLAQYATGCLWYTFFLDRDPGGIDFARLQDYPELEEGERGKTVEPEDVTWIQTRVWELYRDSH